MTIAVAVTVFTLAYSIYNGHNQQRALVRARTQAGIDQVQARSITIRATASGQNIPLIYGDCYYEALRVFTDVNNNFVAPSTNAVSLYDGLIVSNIGQNSFTRPTASTGNTRFRQFNREVGARFRVGTNYYRGMNSTPYRVTSKFNGRYFYQYTVYNPNGPHGDGEFETRGAFTDYTVITFNRTISNTIPAEDGWNASPNVASAGIGDVSDKSGRNNQFLIGQFIGGLGNHELIDFNIDGVDHRDTKYADSFNLTWLGPIQNIGGIAVNPRNNIAELQSPDKRGFDGSKYPYFDGCFVITGIFKKNLNPQVNPPYGREPFIQALLRGEGILNHAKATLNSNGRTYSFLRVNDTRADIVGVVYDILRSKRFHPSFSEDYNIDHASFKIAAIENQSLELVHRPEGRMYDPNKNDRAIPQSKTHALFEYNGAIPTDLTLYDRLLRVLSGSPGVILFRDLQSKWKISLPQSSEPSNIVNVFEDNDVIIANTALLTYPDSAGKLNEFTVDFANNYKDGQDDSMTYTDGALVTSDGGLPLAEKRFTDGVVLPEHAWNIARMHVALSRAPVFSCRLDYTMATLEPGDMILVNATRLLGISFTPFRVESITIRIDGTVEISSRQHDYDDWIYQEPPTLS